MGLVYLPTFKFFIPTFAIEINQMYVNIPYMESILWVRIEENFDHPTVFCDFGLWFPSVFRCLFSAWMIQSYWLFSSHERCAIDSVVISHSVFLSQYNMLFTYSMVRTYAPKYLNGTLILILLAISSNWKRCFFQRMSSCFRAQKIMFTHNCIMG